MTDPLHNPHGTAFGLMDEVYGPGTAQALRDSGGPWEVFYHDGLWTLATAPTWHVAAAYRLKPQPPKPREWWLFWSESHGEWLVSDNHEYALKRHQNETTPIVHVRAVLP